MIPTACASEKEKHVARILANERFTSAKSRNRASICKAVKFVNCVYLFILLQTVLFSDHDGQMTLGPALKMLQNLVQLRVFVYQVHVDQQQAWKFGNRTLRARLDLQQTLDQQDLLDVVPGAFVNRDPGVLLETDLEQRSIGTSYILELVICYSCEKLYSHGYQLKVRFRQFVFHAHHEDVLQGDHSVLGLHFWQIHRPWVKNEMLKNKIKRLKRFLRRC